MEDSRSSDELQAELRRAWGRFLDVVEPSRPGLHRYCRRMAGNVWEAEDLMQETLLRAFGTIGRRDLAEIGNPRAYLFRIATNLWIDQVGRRRADSADLDTFASSEPGPEQTAATREAGAALIEFARPQERAAVVLKDVFDFTLEEIASLLSTTIGAVKSALHRGRARLQAPLSNSSHGRRAPSTELVDHFVEAFNARDIPRLTELLLQNVTLEVQGVGGERGHERLMNEKDGWFPNTMYGHDRDEGGIRRAERRLYRGEPIIVHWRRRDESEAIEEVDRLEEEDGRVARIRDYSYCPETLSEVAAELGLPVRTHGYRHQFI
ncbi:MAG: sigma-70 family RNA polymerase sigma factor [Candidatus Binataceae bacterium]